MKMNVIGIEIQEGIGKKSNRAYSMGAIHTMSALAPPLGEGNVAKGFAGDRLECDAAILRKIEHLAFPLTCEVETQRQIRFGEAREIVVDLKPIAVVKQAA